MNRIISEPRAENQKNLDLFRNPANTLPPPAL